MTTFYFGPRWDAPLLDDNAEQVPTPVGERCSACTEPIADGDRGLMRGHVTMENGKPIGSIRPVHTECEMLSVIGHTYGVCGCTGFDHSRAAGLALLERLNEQRRGLGQRDL